MPVRSNLISIDDALNASKSEVKEWFREYINPDLCLTLELVGFDEVYDRAEGITVYVDGKPYLDFLCGYGVAALGHNHPEIIKEIYKVKEQPNFFQAALSPLTAALARNLALITPGSLRKSFFCNSGAEAVEGALKLARAATHRKKIIYTENSFHGKTMGALSATGRGKYQAPFEPLLPDFESIPFGDSEALREKLREGDVAAFIVEPIQGEGGVILPPEGYLKESEKLCREYEALLILDEIQTGLGRTGAMFACEHEGVEPDILCLAKALSGAAIPIGVYITTDEIWKKAYGSMERCLLHTSTFGGNAWACAAALATLDLLCRDKGRLIKEAGDKGEYFLNRLESLKNRNPIVKEVRGKGLMIGMEFDQPKFLKGALSDLFRKYSASLVASELKDEYSVITAYTLNNPNVIRFLPPLLVSTDQIDYLVESLDKICHRGFSGVVLGAGWKAGKRLIRKGFTREYIE
ncbi:MAG: aspartate aminotransferase family protein [Actinomycetota bacterium]|nr:aspartate aminotransferase family protein [Actinomycetota bacterium]